MATINFSAFGADFEYELHDLGRSEQLRVNGETVVDAWGDVGAWGADYHLAVAGLSGAAKQSATDKYMRTRAEQCFMREFESRAQTIKDLSEQ